MTPLRLLQSWMGLLLILAQSPLAEAQVALPNLRLPNLTGNGLGLPLNADRTLSGLSNDLDPRQLENLRRLHILDLIRKNPKEVEADPRGAPIVRGEVVAFSPSDEAMEKAHAAGFVVLRERVLEGLDARLVVLRGPQGVATRRALQQLRVLDPQGEYDFNHIYTDSGEVGAAVAVPAGGGEVAAAATVTKVGLIDAGVDVSHTVFRDIVIHQHGCSGAAIPAAHGTAVASLMIGRAPRFHGAAPGSELYAADVYCGLPTGGAVDAVAEAFSWLVRERVAVINVSLVGPANVMLENVVRLVVARGHVVVAAVGNDGPAAPPLYPASYPDVVGVTAVDAHRRVLLEACRGRQVKLWRRVPICRRRVRRRVLRWCGERPSPRPLWPGCWLRWFVYPIRRSRGARCRIWREVPLISGRRDWTRCTGLGWSGPIYTRRLRWRVSRLLRKARSRGIK